MKSKGIGLALILVFLLAGCGTTTQVSTFLQVTRSESLPGYQYAPVERTVHNTTAVQQLYAAALALPTPQPGVNLCPGDVGLVYHLNFFGDRFTFQHMDLDATGWLSLAASQPNRSPYDHRLLYLISGSDKWNLMPLSISMCFT